MEAPKLNVDIDVRTIASYYCTTDALTPVVDALNIVLNGYYTVNRPVVCDSLRQTLPYEVLQGLSFRTYVDKIDVIDDNVLFNHVKQLHANLKSLNVFHVKLAFQPSKDFISVLYAKVVSLVGNVVAMDIEYDKRILGGAVVTYNGLYRDMSLFSYIGNYFAKNKQYVQKLL